MIKRGLALLFERREFGLLMAAQFCAQAGDGIVQAALAKSIVFGAQRGFDLEGATQPDELLRIALYIFVPYTIVSPFLGVVIDHWDRRRLLLVANGLRAVVIALVAVAGITGNPLFLAFLLTLACTRVVLATKAASMPLVVEEDELVAGNAVSQLGGSLFQLGGAAVAVVGAKVLSTTPIVLAGAVVYAAGAVASLLLTKLSGDRSPAELLQEVAHVARNIADGVREVAARPKAGASITTYFWLRLLWSMTVAGIGFEALTILGNNDLVKVALIGGAGAAGAVMGFVLASKARDRVSTTARLVLAACVIAGVAVTVLGGLEQKYSLALLTLLLGFGFFLGKISLDTMVQEALGDDFRGRAFSLYDIAYNLAWVIAAGVMKLLWSDLHAALIAGMGVVFLAGTFLLAFWYRRAGLLTPAS